MSSNSSRLQRIDPIEILAIKRDDSKDIQKDLS
jgi:hypothetical protein